jgi:hypothetical protein
MYPVLKITHMLNFLDTFSIGVTGRLEELSLLGMSTVLQDIENEKWVWLLNSSKKSFARSVYVYLISIYSNVIVAHNNVWLTAALLKVSLFVWWLLLNRIPTKANFLSRGIVTNNDCRCIGGCDMVEDRNHL